jgi:uncharacterized protein
VITVKGKGDKMLTEEIIQIIRQLNPLIEEKYKARVLSVFGSYARGEESKTSDLDVLVEFYPGANLLDLVGISNLLEDELDIHVDVVPVDTLRPEIKDQVFKEALAV